MPSGRLKTEDIRLADRTIRHGPSGKVIELTITKFEYCKHIKTRRDIASAQLTRLQRFRNLSKKNKRKLYITIVRCKLVYPPIPMHTASKTQISTLQKVQNRATRLITNTTKTDRQRSERLHELAVLEPINVTLHRLAENIWTNITDTFRANLT